MTNLKPQNIRGKLDPTKAIGRGTIIEYVVLESMGDCVKQNFNYIYDLKSDRLGEINVKSSKLYNTDGKLHWDFSIKLGEYVPDYYVCVALDEYFSEILHVWEIPRLSNIIGYKKISISNSNKGIIRVKQFEVESTKYNNVFLNMDITKYREFRNLNKPDIDIRYQKSKYEVPHGFSMTTKHKIKTR